MRKSSNLTQPPLSPSTEKAQISNSDTKSPSPKRRSQIIRLDEVAPVIENTRSIIARTPEPSQSSLASYDCRQDLQLTSTVDEACFSLLEILWYK